METSPEVDFESFDKEVIIDLLERQMVDSTLLVRVAQLMMMAEFKEFFDALCEIGLSESSNAAAELRNCAELLTRPSLEGLDLEAGDLQRTALPPEAA